MVVFDELFSLTGRVALVTGGNGGLGLACARALRAAGAGVVVTGRDAEKNLGVAVEFEVLELDVRDERQVQAVIGQVVDRHGRLDILVNNAGIFRDQAALDVDLDGWDEVLQTNLSGALLCAKHAAAAMIAAGHGGKILNVGSMFSVFGHPAGIGYVASKTAVVGLTRALAVELGAHGIQVNAILPGWFETAMNEGVSPERREAIRRRMPAGRWGQPDDVAGVVVFLASAASGYVTGTALPVDGGYLVSERDLS